MKKRKIPKKRKISLPRLKAKLQDVFNLYVRLRDEGKPCISCGKVKRLQAGHFYSVRMYDGLRFNEDNCHGECASCNGFDDSHLINYNFNLIERIGEQRYNDLKYSAHIYKADGYKWTRSELEEMIEEYTLKLKNLK